MINVPVSVGELIDKLTILSIKMKCITDPDRLRNVSFELSQLYRVLEEQGIDKSPEYDDLFTELYACNYTGWQYEDEIRELQRQGKIDLAFAELTNQTHLNNDRRMKIKARINSVYKSAIVEEKSYKE